MKLSQYHVQWTGHYHVARELVRRGYFVSPTPGNAKTNDLMVSKADATAFVVEVKTSARDTGWFVKEPPGHKNRFWFFVILPEKDRDFRIFIARGDEANERWHNANRPGAKAPGFHVRHIKDWENRWDVLP